MLKCGQKDNKNYTFGVRIEQREQIKEANHLIYCGNCGSCVSKNMKFCPFCREK